MNKKPATCTFPDCGCDMTREHYPCTLTPPLSASAPAGAPDTESLAKMLSHVFIGDGCDWRNYLTKAGQLRDRILDWLRNEGQAPAGALSEEDVARVILGNVEFALPEEANHVARLVLALLQDRKE